MFWTAATSRSALTRAIAFVPSLGAFVPSLGAFVPSLGAQDFKPRYGTSMLTAFGQLDRHPVGVVRKFLLLVTRFC